MHITAECPSCHVRYQLNPTLVGQMIRCPGCTDVFVVKDVGVVAPPPRKNTSSGTVSDFVPVLRAEEVVDDKKSAGNEVFQIDPPKPAADWQMAPPPVRQASDAVAPPVPPPAPPRARPTVADKPRPEPVKSPTRKTSGEWIPPPVRVITDADVIEEVEPQPAEVVEAADHAEGPVTTVAPPHARLVRRLVLGVIAGCFLFAAVFGLGVWIYAGQTEVARFEHAVKEFQAGRFSKAAGLFKNLGAAFPASDNLAEYDFLRDLSEMRGAVEGRDPDDVLDKVAEFVDAHKDKDKAPLLKKYADGLGDVTAKAVETLAATEKGAPGPDTPARLDKAQFVLGKVEAAGGWEGRLDRRKALDAGLAEAAAAHARWQRYKDALDRILAVGQSPPGLIPPAERIKTVRRLVKQETVEFPDIGGRPEVTQLLASLFDMHQKSVVFEIAAPRADDRPAAPPRPEEASLIVTAATGQSPAAPDQSIVLALARGVLYALNRGNGVPRWAVRVGVDTTTLPVRVPASLANPERILVLSADTESLTALDDQGREAWRYRMSSPCLGRPVVVGRSVFLPTYEGKVHEVELAGGQPLGAFNLGQRLTTGGVWEGEDSTTVYFPADDLCVYALDVAAHTCTGILYSDHPSGSLRGEPLVVAVQRRAIAGVQDSFPGYLILNQTQGLDAVQLRVFELPFKDRDATALPLQSEPRLEGWTWFTPFHDGEKVALITDAGRFGLFGIKQPRNRDEALFPWQMGPVDLDKLLAAGGGTRNRAQVVHADGDDFWVLSRGQMQRLQIVWSEGQGRKLTAGAGWPGPLTLGSPLHASQVEEGRAPGETTLVVVTQSQRQQVCLASAVDSETGRLLWQRQLGLLCRGAPVPLRDPKAPPGAPPLLVALDRSGALFLIDPDPASRRGPHILAPALDDDPAFPPLLLPAGDGATAYEIACPGDGSQMLVRSIKVDPDARSVSVADLPRAKLDAAPVGLPALVGDHLVLNLANSTTVRMPLAGGPLEQGPTWRSSAVGAEAPGYVTALGEDRFVTTDGARGLKVFEWPADAKGGRTWSPLPKDRKLLTLALKDRITAAPLLLPRSGRRPDRLLVADAGDVLRLLRVKEDGGLEEARENGGNGPPRTWQLPGRLTAGPFLRTVPGGKTHVGCIVDGRRLVWIELERPQKFVEYRTRGEAIVGEPQIVDGLVVVADLSGRIVALDPTTLKPVGPDYALQGSVTPSATPSVYDGRSLFIPLSDGTILLPPLDALHPPSPAERLRGFLMPPLL